MKKLFKLNADEQAPFFKYFFLTTKLKIDREHVKMTIDTSDYLGMLPKLEALHHNNSYCQHYYFRYILDISSRKCLDKVQTFCSATFHKAFKVIYKYREKLTTLEYTHRILSYSQMHRSTLCESLRHLKNPTSLTLVNAYVSNLTRLEIQLA
ncbi:uncharacterized protein EV154DRAFT_477775 [Mucor mucedo]|uniref:uncharacterized protein n=1 Tax=Mucor mucedo TaxID=29922 RepID=UPI00221F375F|nr:uncharacterized protein EV154DRAFT_477775 [Mucor mucedo]KAI7894999.1 hypothetical protein EV154DRAFT_477775 [Mucor mucedo]